MKTKISINAETQVSKNLYLENIRSVYRKTTDVNLSIYIMIMLRVHKTFRLSCYGKKTTEQLTTTFANILLSYRTLYTFLAPYREIYRSKTSLHFNRIAMLRNDRLLVVNVDFLYRLGDFLEEFIHLHCRQKQTFGCAEVKQQLLSVVENFLIVAVLIS